MKKERKSKGKSYVAVAICVFGVKKETAEGHACEMKQRETLADAKKGILTREDGVSQQKRSATWSLCNGRKTTILLEVL